MFSSIFCSDLATCHPGLGVDDTIMSRPLITSTVTAPASPTLNVVRSPVGAAAGTVTTSVDGTVDGVVEVVVEVVVEAGNVLAIVDELDVVDASALDVDATCSGTAAD